MSDGAGGLAGQLQGREKPGALCRGDASESSRRQLVQSRNVLAWAKFSEKGPTECRRIHPFVRSRLTLLLSSPLHFLQPPLRPSFKACKEDSWDSVAKKWEQGILGAGVPGFSRSSEVCRLSWAGAAEKRSVKLRSSGSDGIRQSLLAPVRILHQIICSSWQKSMRK